MKVGDIVREKISGHQVVLIRKNKAIWRFLDGKEWEGKVRKVYPDGGEWQYKDFFESELEEPPESTPHLLESRKGEM